MVSSQKYSILKTSIFPSKMNKVQRNKVNEVHHCFNNQLNTKMTKTYAARSAWLSG